MKKLLLFAVTMGLSTLSFAQTGLISVDAIISPSGTVTTQDPANGTSEIRVTITNNETSFTYVANQTQFNFNIKVDGVLINDPAGSVSTPEILIPIFSDLAPGASIDLILATNWAAQGDPGQHEICVELIRIFANASTPPLITNTDQNKSFCDNFTFAWPVGISELNSAEISNIKTEGDVMTVSVINTSSVTELKLMSITGQVFKSVIASNGGQDFIESFDISNLSSGVYIVSIQTENGASQAQKVFVQ
ncbi:MAG: hypothetical protein ACI85Q_000913 [Salibacteraceae bacterium]|jgi:hypothetical protein